MILTARLYASRSHVRSPHKARPGRPSTSIHGLAAVAGTLAAIVLTGILVRRCVRVLRADPLARTIAAAAITIALAAHALGAYRGLARGPTNIRLLDTTAPAPAWRPPRSSSPSRAGRTSASTRSSPPTAPGSSPSPRRGSPSSPPAPDNRSCVRTSSPLLSSGRRPAGGGPAVRAVGRPRRAGAGRLAPAARRAGPVEVRQWPAGQLLASDQVAPSGTAPQEAWPQLNYRPGNRG